MKLRRWRSIGPLFILALSSLLSGCGADGVAEFQLYNQAFNFQFEQGDAILDSVARAERIVVLRGIKHAAFIPDFKPDHAAYFVDTVDPPITGSIRASLKSLKSYNDALGALANGEAADALSQRFGTLATNVVVAVAASQVAFGGLAAIPGADTLASESAKALASVAPIIKQVATIASREAFRQQLIAAYPLMRELLLALRNGTPAMFEILKRSRVVRASLENASGIPAAGLADLEKERMLLAAWVMLLDKTLVAKEAAVLAVTSEAPSMIGLASLSEASIEMRILAEQVKSLRSK
jgi:hypothetical protein